MRIIAGDAGGRKLKRVHRSGTRPTMNRVRESLFAILSDRIEGVHLLDLFAGTGSIGFEAISRGAERVVFVDSSAGCARVIQENAHLMQCSDRTLVVPRAWQTALQQLSGRGERFHIVFADPPYDQEAVLTSVGEELLERQLLHTGGWLILQHTVRLRLGDTIGQLRTVDQRKFGETMLTFLRLPE